MEKTGAFPLNKSNLEEKKCTGEEGKTRGSEVIKRQNEQAIVGKQSENEEGKNNIEGGGKHRKYS